MSYAAFYTRKIREMCEKAGLTVSFCNSRKSGYFEVFRIYDDPKFKGYPPGAIYESRLLNRAVLQEVEQLIKEQS